MLSNDTLPRFTERTNDSKNRPMTSPIEPPQYIQRFLNKSLEAMGRVSPLGVRLLDVGCGRGDTVAWLLSRGWNAHGVDICPDYLEHGRQYLDRIGADRGRLQVLDNDFRYPFPDSSFDLVLSDQVIEHVSDLDSFGREIARVSAVGATGLHIYPAKWRPIEVHMATPLVHWLPKGPLRRNGIASLIRLGLAAPYFEGLSHRERVKIFVLFSETETFYRSMKRTVTTLERYGLECDVIASSRDKIAFHVPWLPGGSIPGFAWLYRHAFSVVLHTRRISSESLEDHSKHPTP
jgi:SAM-dependent methyltransferase